MCDEEIAFFCLLQAVERNFSPHIHRIWEAYFSPCLYTNFPFSENLQNLSERLIGPFDIEDVVDPIGVSISEGIMNFQNSGYEITGKVFQDCGTPRLQKRQVGCKTIHFLGELKYARFIQFF